MSKTDQFWQYAKEAGSFRPATPKPTRTDGATDELRRRLLFHLLVEERENLKRLERGDAQNSTEVMRGSK
jgi:hypothetical protein